MVTDAGKQQKNCFGHFNGLRNYYLLQCNRIDPNKVSEAICPVLLPLCKGLSPFVHFSNVSIFLTGKTTKFIMNFKLSERIDFYIFFFLYTIKISSRKHASGSYYQYTNLFFHISKSNDSEH